MYTMLRQFVQVLAKLDVPTSVTQLNRTPISEWYVVRCGSNNGYLRDMCSKDIGLRVQNVMTVLSLIVNIIDGDLLYDHFMSIRIFTLMINEIFIRALNIMRKTTMTLNWIWNHLILLMWFISQEKWASIWNYFLNLKIKN